MALWKSCDSSQRMTRSIVQYSSFNTCGFVSSSIVYTIAFTWLSNKERRERKKKKKKKRRKTSVKKPTLFRSLFQFDFSHCHPIKNSLSTTGFFLFLVTFDASVKNTTSPV
jgi:ornithine carbamoyltransferase